MLVDYSASERYEISMTIATYDYWLADSGSWNGDEVVDYFVEHDDFCLSTSLL